MPLPTEAVEAEAAEAGAVALAAVVEEPVEAVVKEPVEAVVEELVVAGAGAGAEAVILSEILTPAHMDCLT